MTSYQSTKGGSEPERLRTAGLDEFQVKFLKRFRSSNKFIKEMEEIFVTDRQSVILSLLQPIVGDLSERQRNILTFGINFSSYNVE